MLNFLWPRSRREDPSGVGRFGRVLHWIAAGLAIGLGVPALCGLAWSVGLMFTTLPIEHPATSDAAGNYVVGWTEYPGRSQAATCLDFVAVAAMLWVTGRGLRYLLSGE